MYSEFCKSILIMSIDDYVVTEYGVAHLKYKTRRERARALIAVAHPDLKGELEASLKKNYFPSS